MDNTNLGIKFYSLGSEKLDLSKLLNKSEIDKSKPIIPSKKFNEALNSVIKKDIDILNDKIKNIINDIIKRLIVLGISVDFKNLDNIENINNLINKMDELTSELIIKKENIKVGLFTSNKRSLKEKIKQFDDNIRFLSRYQTEFISMKNEYNKLSERNKIVEGTILLEENESEEIKREDPLERTINFYMNKQKS